MQTAKRRALAALAGLALLAGCATEPVQPATQETSKYSVENTEKFMLLDRDGPDFVACTGLQERHLPDGRLEIVANVRNRVERPVRIKLNCVFKDAAGIGTGDETAFDAIELAAGATESVRFTAANTLARRYTIRVRLER